MIDKINRQFRIKVGLHMSGVEHNFLILLIIDFWRQRAPASINNNKK